MSELFFTATGCLVLGMMSTLHPCPLAANISAISYLAGTTRNKRNQITLFILFSLGYLLAILIVAIVINFSLLSIPKLSIYLQSIVSAFLGPMLIFVGMVLAKMINLNHTYKSLLSAKSFKQTHSSLFTFLMGMLLALSFCPATAFIFFGILIPLSVDNNQMILLPSSFAIGAILPIVTISMLINRGFLVTLNEKWSRRIHLIAGWILILTGIYITLEQLYI